jgi:hypothetical protein
MGQHEDTKVTTTERLRKNSNCKIAKSVETRRNIKHQALSSVADGMTVFSFPLSSVPFGSQWVGGPTKTNENQHQELGVISAFRQPVG